MPRPITSIRNLGPASAAGFARAGIDSAEALEALGPDAAYARLIAAGARPHFIGYYAMVMGLMGRPWNDCRGAEKDALRARFDAIVAQAGAPADPQAPGLDRDRDPGRNPDSDADRDPDPNREIERALDAIGLPAPRAR